ncbi:hypothetical protein ACMAUO_10255 [Gluconacetobacter sp. Hr-1-5]|uniref:hypothetical protein n=1 Tax=Gluconacetobacter sp. Hr-1-5 TaxID=3395370 RepID=UPI003B528CD7
MPSQERPDGPDTMALGAPASISESDALPAMRAGCTRHPNAPITTEAVPVACFLPSPDQAPPPAPCAV